MRRKGEFISARAPTGRSVECQREGGRAEERKSPQSTDKRVRSLFTSSASAVSTLSARITIPPSQQQILGFLPVLFSIFFCQLFSQLLDVYVSTPSGTACGS